MQALVNPFPHQQKSQRRQGGRDSPLARYRTSIQEQSLAELGGLEMPSMMESINAKLKDWLGMEEKKKKDSAEETLERRRRATQSGNMSMRKQLEEDWVQEMAKEKK